MTIYKVSWITKNWRGEVSGKNAKYFDKASSAIASAAAHHGTITQVEVDEADFAPFLNVRYVVRYGYGYYYKQQTFKTIDEARAFAKEKKVEQEAHYGGTVSITKLETGGIYID
jgi:hypothetical protein